MSNQLLNGVLRRKGRMQGLPRVDYIKNGLDFGQNNSTQVTLPAGVTSSSWTNEWTFSVWFRYNKPFPSSNAVDTFQTSSSGNFALFRHSRITASTWRIQFLGQKASGSVATVQSAALSFDYAPHNLIYTSLDIGGGNYTLTIYYDGVSVASGTVTSAQKMAAMTNALLGKNLGVDSFNGVIGDLRLLENYVASQAVVTAHYNKGIGSNNLDAITSKFWYKFNETSGTTSTADSSANAYTGTMAGFTGNPFVSFF